MNVKYFADSINTQHYKKYNDDSLILYLYSVTAINLMTS